MSYLPERFSDFNVDKVLLAEFTESAAVLPPVAWPI